MTSLGVIQVSLCVLSLAAAAILIPIVRYQIYRHLRRQHRNALDRLGISSAAFLWSEDREAKSTAYEQFVSSRIHQMPNDPRLDALRRRESLIWRACGVTFALLLVSFAVFRADPGHVWEFLTDLGHY
jgi:hypothetical protein